MFLNKINKAYTAMLNTVPEVVYGQCGGRLIRYGSLVLRLVLALILFGWNAMRTDLQGRYQLAAFSDFSRSDFQRAT